LINFAATLLAAGTERAIKQSRREPLATDQIFAHPATESTRHAEKPEAGLWLAVSS